MSHLTLWRNSSLYFLTVPVFQPFILTSLSIKISLTQSLIDQLNVKVFQLAVALSKCFFLCLEGKRSRKMWSLQIKIPVWCFYSFNCNLAINPIRWHACNRTDCKTMFLRELHHLRGRSSPYDWVWLAVCKTIWWASISDLTATSVSGACFWWTSTQPDQNCFNKCSLCGVMTKLVNLLLLHTSGASIRNQMQYKE